MPLEIIREDITRMKVDAIVNAANTSLLGGGGVDGAIHAAAGPELLEECRKLGGCPTGEARITRGYRLPAKYVIHTPGPVWQDGQHGEPELLAACYRNSLRLAEEYGCESIAFPMISTGIYGYPKDKALSVATDEIAAFLAEHEMRVYLVTFGKEMFELTGKIFAGVRAYVDDAYTEQKANRFFRRILHRPPADANVDYTIVPSPEKLKDREESANYFEDFAEPAKEAMEERMEDASSVSFHAQLTEAIPEITGPKHRPRPDALPWQEDQAAPDLEDTLQPCAGPVMGRVSPEDLKQYLKAQDIGFSEALLQWIDRRGMTDAQCYRKANIDRKLFNHIKNQRDYRPSKKTVLAFAVALEMKPREAEELLGRAGYSLSDSSRMDRAIRYFLERRFYDVNRINIMLYDLDLPQLGG